MADQRISTQLLLDASLTDGYKDAFSSANKLMGDLNKHSNALERELKALGRSADQIDKIGDSSDLVRRDMVKLERQIKETNRAVSKFGDAKMHFRNAKLGSTAFRNDLTGLASVAKTAGLAVAGIGIGAGYATLRGLQEFSNFDHILRTLQAEGVSGEEIPIIREQIFKLAETSQFTDLEIGQVLVGMKKDGQEVNAELTGVADIIKLAVAESRSLPEAWDATRTLINTTKTDLAGALKLQEQMSNATSVSALNMEQLAYIAGVSLSTYESISSFKSSDFLALAGQLGGILRPERIATGLREFALTMADAAAGVLADPRQEAFDLLGLDITDEEGKLKDAVSIIKEFERAFNTAEFRDSEGEIIGERIQPILAKIFGREALPTVSNLIFNSDDISKNIAEIESIGTLDRKAAVMEQSINAAANRLQSALSVAGKEFFLSIDDDGNFTQILDSVSGRVQTFTEYIREHRADIQNFFTGIRDTVSPVIQNIWERVKTAYPDIKTFATEVWDELRGYLNAILPPARAFASAVWNILQPILSFVQSHPKLVATVLTGIAAWKAYKFATQPLYAAFDFLAGGASLLQGHYHKLNATVIGNQRELAKTGNTALSTGRKFLDMGKNIIGVKFPRFTGIITGLGKIGITALSSLPGITAMGAGLWGAMIPLLPIILPVIAAIGIIAGLGYVIYRNWEVLKPLFSEIWNTIKLSAQIAWEGIKFIALSTVNFVMNVWNGITGFFGGVWQAVHGVIMDSPLAPIFEGLVAGVMAVVSPLVNFFSGIWGGIRDAASGVITWITDRFKGLNEILDRWLGWLRNKNKDLADEIKGIETTAETNITQPITTEKTAVSSTNVANPMQMATIDDLNIPSVEINQEQPIVNIGQSPIEQNQPIVNIGETPIEQTQPIVNIGEQSQPVVSVDTQRIEQPIIEQTQPIVNIGEQSQPVVSVDTQRIEQPIIEQTQPIVNIGEQSQPVVSVDTQRIEQPIIEQTQPIVNAPNIATEQTITSPVVNIPEGTQPVIDVAQPTLQELNIPSADVMQDNPIVNLDSPVVNQESPIVETPQNTPYTPIAGSPVIPPSGASNVSTVSNQTSTDNGRVSITNHFTINASSQEAGEEIEDTIRQVIREQLAEMPEGFTTQ